MATIIDPHQRDRDEDLPAQGHELVVAQPRQRGAQPDEQEQERPHLGGEPQQRPPAGVGAVAHVERPRRVPAAEEQRGGQRRDGGHVDVLGEHEHRELQRRVLGVEAADQFALGLGQIEWGAVGFADHRGDVDQERRQQQEHVPEAVLGGDDARGRHGARVEEHRGERQRHRDLVGDHLGGTSAARRAADRSSRTPSRPARCRTRRSR